jgi:ribonuclease PH
MRALARKNDQMRKVELTPGVAKFADGSCLASFGDTKVLCTATIENRVPFFLKGSGSGWVTAEYGMLPRSTQDRMERESMRGRPGGRTHEIQRLIGRSLRAVCELGKIGEHQVIVDCDVLQADGGTRTAAITGGFVALYQAMQKLKFKLKLDRLPINDYVAAASCGIVEGALLLDLDFDEDSTAETDANFVITGSGGIVEVQGTAERVPFTEHELTKMLATAKKGIFELIALQKKALSPEQPAAALAADSEAEAGGDVGNRAGEGPEAEAKEMA